MNKTLFILPVLGIMLAACSKQETAPAVKTISFDSHTFKEGKHNNSPVANGDSTYTEFGATFSINYYYSYLSGIMLSEYFANSCFTLSLFVLFPCLSFFLHPAIIFCI